MKKAKELAKHRSGGSTGPVENAVLTELRARAERESWSTAGAAGSESVGSHGKPGSQVACRLMELTEGTNVSDSSEIMPEQTSTEIGEAPVPALETAQPTAQPMPEVTVDPTAATAATAIVT
eukprot:3006593-Rhodomonas_salina.1